MPEATLRAKLTGDSADFKRSLREGMASAREFGTEVAARMREVAAQVAVVTLGVESLGEAFERSIESVKAVFEMSKELEHLSDRTGIATRDLVQLQTEFKLSGLEADQVGTTINRMQRSIENAVDKGGDAAQVFQRLGLNLRDLQGMDPAAQFETVRKAIAGIPDPARRAQAAMDIFGRSGAEMLSLFKNQGIGKEAADALGGQADILARNSETFQKVASDMAAVGIKIQGFFVGLAEPIGNVILPVLNKLGSVDLVSYGEKIGNSIASGVRVLYNAFEDGRLAELFADSIKYGFAKGINYLEGGASYISEAIQDVFARLATPEFGAGFKDTMIGVADAFIGEMMKLLQPFADGMRAIFNSLVVQLFEGVNRVIHALGLNGELDITTVGPTTAAGVRGARVDAYNQQQLKAEGLNFDDPNVEPTPQQTQRIHQILTQNIDPGSGIAGFGTDDWTKAGGDHLRKGADELVNAFKGLGDQISKIKFTEGNILDSAKYKDDLAKLFTDLSGKLPGEGKPNEPDAPRNDQPGNDRMFGKGDLSGIHRNEDGNWVSYSSSGQGAVAFGDAGSAGRAGRVVANPDGPNAIEIVTQIRDLLKTIGATVANVAEPA